MDTPTITPKDNTCLTCFTCMTCLACGPSPAVVAGAVGLVANIAVGS